MRPSLMLIVACCWLASTAVASGDDKLRIELEGHIARLEGNYRTLDKRLADEMKQLKYTESGVDAFLYLSKRDAEGLARVRGNYDTAVVQAERCKEFVKLVNPIKRANGEVVYTGIVEIPQSWAQSAWEFFAPNERANCLDWLWGANADLRYVAELLDYYDSDLRRWKRRLVEEREKLKTVKAAAKQTRLARRKTREQIKEFEDRLAKLPPCVEPEVEPENSASGSAAGPSSEEEQSNELDSGNPTIPELNLDDLEADDDSAAQDFTPPDPDDVLESEDTTGEVPAGPHGAEDILDALRDEKGPTSDPTEPESSGLGSAAGPSSEEEQSNELDSGYPTIPELNLDDLEADDDSAAQDFTPPDPDDVLESEDSTGEAPAGPHGAEDILDALRDEKGPTSDPTGQGADVDDGGGTTGLTLPEPAQTTPIAAPKTPDTDVEEITMFPPDVIDAEGDAGTGLVDAPDMLPDPDDILDPEKESSGANSTDQGQTLPIAADNNGADVPVDQGTQVSSAVPVDPATLADLIPEPMIFVSGRRDQTSHCDYDPVLACRKLGGERAQICEVAVAEWVASCRTLGAITDTQSPAHCVAECNVYADQALLDDQLRPLISSLIEQPDENKDEAAQLEAQLMAISDEIAALNKQLDAGVLHIYQHETTGEITQHDGPYFEPSPPLEYTGSIRKTPTAEQRAKLLDLELLAEEYTERLREASNGDPFYSQWQNFARGFWFGIDGDTSQMSKFTCTAAQAESARAACIDKCNTANGSGEVCDPFVSAIGMLNQPFSRIYLYPPGNALRVPVN
ncbi:hypothetical protein GCM10007879_32850 [Maritalea porphyrae]|uniref:DUF4189 domain-containing protein n=1 Tax=Maritalea porphyrae TaxID=880732 RepID=A0ABQ5UV61_9HYPH|nr:hypothetical protein GCM10007879_32850 [Maritalea porphyrae]